MKNAQEMTAEEFQEYMAQDDKEPIFLGMVKGVDEDDELAAFYGPFNL